jgi:hypothetical protein
VHPAESALGVVFHAVPFAAARSDDDSRSESKASENLAGLRFVSNDRDVPAYRRETARLGRFFFAGAGLRVRDRARWNEFHEVKDRVALVLVIDVVEPNAFEFF